MALNSQIFLHLLNDYFGAIKVEALSHDKSLLLPSAADESHLRPFSTQAASLLINLPMNWVILCAQ